MFGLQRFLTTFAAAIVASGIPAEAQRARPDVGVFDPPKMLEEMFGPDTDEQEQALAKIKVSLAEERRVGAQAVRAFTIDLKGRGIKVTDSGRDVDYLQDLVNTIQPRMKNAKRYPKIKVYVAKSPIVEARSFPGGTLVFFEGMLERAENEAALISVVGHELSHLDRGHQLHRVRQWKLAQRQFSGRSGLQSPQQFMQSGMMLAKMWTRPFRPEDEMEADRDGVRWAYLAGYDPRELAKFFESFSAERKARAALPSFLQSHPDSRSRQQAVIDLYRELQAHHPADRLYIGELNLLRRIARSRKELER